MSVQLGVWPQDVPLTLEALAQDLAAGATPSDELVLGFGPDLEMIETPEAGAPPEEPHPATAAFYADLTARFPDLAEDNYLDSPWSEPLTVGRHTVLMSVVFARAGEVCRLVNDLAIEHELLCFAPRDLPPRPNG
ncbi:hypothetical protein [Nonomuraea cavernae]|uniref:Uncharacterized protein n=1 Tax=Nonomuraea cavernae TaxID=2045107 RepID=A0A918DRW0_9ACTN|nr:hypothetical protein [Nonomuraea cavernae]MCA2190453.1 hypothetical protein [Nonomuraea cavernae]GGO79592.1 hypothetical protein GCM10012289_64240 [Nonomuraea cavernae]